MGKRYEVKAASKNNISKDYIKSAINTNIIRRLNKFPTDVKKIARMLGFQKIGADIGGNDAYAIQIDNDLIIFDDLMQAAFTRYINFFDLDDIDQDIFIEATLSGDWGNEEYKEIDHSLSRQEYYSFNDFIDNIQLSDWVW